MPVQGKAPAPPAASKKQQITVRRVQWQTRPQRIMVWKMRILCASSEKKRKKSTSPLGSNLCTVEAVCASHHICKVMTVFITHGANYVRDVF